MAMSPLSPSRSDYRVIRKLLDSSFSGEVLHIRDEYDLVIRVFEKAGGSWEKLFLGSNEEMSLLRKIIKIAIKKHYMTPSQSWI